jgi:hypothetical protein
MKDLEDVELKAEMDEIMRSVENIMKNVERILPSQNNAASPVEE